LLQFPKPFDLRAQPLRLFRLGLQQRAQLLANHSNNCSAVFGVHVNVAGHSEVSFGTEKTPAPPLLSAASPAAHSMELENPTFGYLRERLYLRTAGPGRTFGYPRHAPCS